jgi:hypothetical protein
MKTLIAFITIIGQLYADDFPLSLENHNTDF